MYLKERSTLKVSRHAKGEMHASTYTNNVKSIQWELYKDQQLMCKNDSVLDVAIDVDVSKVCFCPVGYPCTHFCLYL